MSARGRGSPRRSGAGAEEEPARGREGVGFRDPLATATMAVVREQGYEAASLAEIGRRAGISRAALGRRFAGKADLVLAVMDANMADFRARVDAAYAGAPSWPDNLRAAGWELVRWIRENPEAVWFDTVGVREAGDMVRVRREELFGWGTALIDAGRPLAPDPGAVPASTPVIVVGSVVEALRREVEGSLPGDGGATVQRMMYAAVRPYLGEEAARAELEIEPPPDLRRGGR
jgi:AcrR family transcriptional regulator